MKRILTFLAVVAAIQLCASSASAVIVSSTGVTSTATASSGTVLGNIIDGTVGGGNGRISAALTEANKYTVNTGTGFAFFASGQFLDNTVNGETFTFAFSGGPSIGEILVWNYSQSAIRGLDAISKIEVNTGSGLFDTGMASFSLTDAGAASFLAQSIILNSVYSGVTQIRLTVAQGDTGGGETAGGFDQVAFSSVPEPGSAAMLIAGIVMGLSRFRRKK